MEESAGAELTGSRNRTRSISLDARGRGGADGADSERQRCRGRAARRRGRWFASSSTIVTRSQTRCEGFAGCRRVWFRWFSFFDCYRSLSRLRLQETSFFCLHLLRVSFALPLHQETSFFCSSTPSERKQRIDLLILCMGYIHVVLSNVKMVECF